MKVMSDGMTVYMKSDQKRDDKPYCLAFAYHSAGTLYTHHGENLINNQRILDELNKETALNISILTPDVTLPLAKMNGVRHKHLNST
jgi:hypothetical protein